MATLANQTISSTYDGLIKTSTDQPVPISGVQLLEDGVGNSLALSVGRANQGVTVTGTLSATALSGPLTGNVTGNLTGTVLTAAQPNITSVGTLSSLAVSGNLTVDTNTLYVNATSDFVGIGTSNQTVNGEILRIAGDVFINSTGTASVPSIALADTNSGFFAPSAGQVAITTQGVERMRIDSSGNVGIGTSSPDISGFSKALTIDGADCGVEIANSGVITAIFSGNTQGANISGVGSSGIRFRTSASGATTERMRIDSSGNVTFSTGDVALINTKALRFYSGSANENAYAIGYDSGIDGVKVRGLNGLVFQTGTGAGTERLRITSAGRIGIGQSNPADALDVNGAIRLGDQYELKFGGTTSTIFGSSSLNQLRFYTNNTERMRIDSSGNVSMTGSGNNPLTISSSSTSYETGYWYSDTKGIGIATGAGTGWTNLLYLDKDSNIAKFFTNGSERMRIDSSGNVGIGTSSLTTIANYTSFNVNGTTGSLLDLYKSGTLSGRIIADTNHGIGMYAVGSEVLKLGTADTERMRIDSSGNVTLRGNDLDLDNGNTLHRITNSNTDLLIRADYSNTSANSTIQFSVDGSEAMRITSGGYLKASNTGSYWSATGVYHELKQSANGNWIAILNHTDSSAPYGIYIPYSGSSPNSAGSEYLYFTDNVGLRFSIRSNGGIANYSSNNVNLSDERVKTDITPLDSYWDKFKALELVTFKYKDQTHDDPNIGLIAQQVELVAPEFVSNEGFSDEDRNTDPLKSIYTADLYHATIKVLQEAMAKIETLEAEVETLKSQINA